jgi:excisionase family DNA binding protein
MKLFNVREAAQVLAVSPWTVRAYIRTGKLQAIRIGRLVRVEEQALEKFIADAKTVCGVVQIQLERVGV